MIGWTKQPEVCLSSNTNSRHFKSSHLFLLMMTNMLSICVVYLTVTKPDGSENVNIMLVLIWNCHVVGFPAPNDHMMDPCFVRLWRPAGVEINNTLNNNCFPKGNLSNVDPKLLPQTQPPEMKTKENKKNNHRPKSSDLQTLMLHDSLPAQSTVNNYTQMNTWAFNWHKQTFIPELCLYTRTLPGWTSASPTGRNIRWWEGREACVLFLVRINILDAGQTNNMSAWDGSCSSLYCEMACGCSRASTTLPERLQEDWARVAILPPRFDFQVETSDYFMHLLFWIVF